MAPRLAVFVVFLLLFACLFAAAADGSKETAVMNENTILTEQVCEPEVTARKLEAQIVGWADAWPTNEQATINQIEGQIHALLACDMAYSEQLVQQLAYRAALSDPSEAFGMESSSPNPHLDFEEQLAILNLKESTLRELVASSELTTKYRRLGDYLNLLRRQLRLPVLKMAATTEHRAGSNQ